MKTRIFINTIVVLGLLFLIAAKLYSNKQQRESQISFVESTKQPVPVIISTVAFDKIPVTFYERGSFEPSNQTTILSESQGKVISINVVPGQTVGKGAVLATLENKTIEYQYALAETAYKKAKSDYERYRNLTPDESISKSQMDDAALALENAKNSYLIAKKQVEDLRITAPIAGKISKKQIDVGSFIMPGSPAFDVVSADKLKFKTALSDEELTAIQKNKIQITIQIESSGTEFTGKVSSIDPIPSNSGRYNVDIEIIDGITNGIPNGKIGKVTFAVLADEKSLTIDRKCIVGNISDASVYLVKDNKAILTKITVGSTIGNKALITAGLSVGDQVVNSGQININNGDFVNITNR